MTFQAEREDRLDRLLQDRFPDHSRSRIAQHIKDGNVSVQGATATKAGTLVKPGMEISATSIEAKAPHELTPANIPLEIPFEDDELLVVNKPRGLATHPAKSLRGEATLVNALLGYGASLSEFGESFRPGIVHRLDKGTTGLLLVAKTDRAHASLQEQIAERTVDRRYLAWLEGYLPEETIRVEAPIGRDPRNPTRMAVSSRGKRAVTIFDVGELGDQTLAFVRLETGRTHQIRVHAAAIDHPVVGDGTYGLAAGPLQLHAASLRFTHPVSGERTVVYAEPEEPFRAISKETWQRFLEWEE